MKVGIFGGTFDPIHNAHLILAQDAHDQFDLDVVIFVPTFDPAYRTVKTPFETRYNICRNVTDLDARFITQPIRQQYMVDTLPAIHSAMPLAEKYLIIGGDQAGSFWTWKAPTLILRALTGVICIERSNYDQERIIDHWGEHAYHLNWLDMPALDMSASFIRQRVKDGRPIRYLVPSAVEEYIQAEGLYQ